MSATHLSGSDFGSVRITLAIIFVLANDIFLISGRISSLIDIFMPSFRYGVNSQR